MPRSRKDFSGYDLRVRSLDVIEDINSPQIARITTELNQTNSNVNTIDTSLVDLINNLAADGIITPIEKRTVAAEWQRINTEAPYIMGRAENAGIKTTDSVYTSYVAAKNALYNYLYTSPAILGNMSENSFITRSEMVEVFNNYVKARQDIFAAIEGVIASVTIINGVEAIGWDAAGHNPTPSEFAAFGAKLFINGVEITEDLSYEWNAYGQLAGSGTGQAFSPTVTDPGLTNPLPTYVKCKITYKGVVASASKTVAVGKSHASLEWLQKWDGTTVQTFTSDGTEYIAAGGIYAGTVIDDSSHPGYKKISKGVFIGKGQVGGVGEFAGLIGVNNGVVTFKIDAATGEAEFGGTLTANVGGQIGGFTISPADGIYAGSGATRVQLKAGFGFWAGANDFNSAPFGVSTAGALKSVSGQIAGFTITNTNLHAGQKQAWDDLTKEGVYVGSDGIGLGTHFKLSADGIMFAEQITASLKSARISNIASGDTYIIKQDTAEETNFLGLAGYKKVKQLRICAHGKVTLYWEGSNDSGAGYSYYRVLRDGNIVLDNIECTATKPSWQSFSYSNIDTNEGSIFELLITPGSIFPFGAHTRNFKIKSADYPGIVSYLGSDADSGVAYVSAITGVIKDDDSNNTRYMLFAGGYDGQTTIYADKDITYNPSTGTFSAGNLVISNTITAKDLSISGKISNDVHIEKYLIKEHTIPGSTDKILQIRNQNTGQTLGDVYTILELRSPDTSQTEATIALHCVVNALDDWVRDISWHNYAGKMKSVDVLQHFTGTDAANFAWVSRYTTGTDYDMIERNIMELEGDTGNLRVGEDSTLQVAARGKLDVRSYGYIDKPSLVVSVDSSHGSQPSAVLVSDGGNFAYAGELVKFKLCNGTDSGTLLKLENAGTGNYLAVDNKLYIDNDGSVKTKGSYGFLTGNALDPELVLYKGGTGFLNLRRYGEDYTILNIWAPPPWAGSREATLVLQRGNEPNVEYIDIYNNGYDSETQYGMRIQKRGTGEYRPFVFDYYDGITKNKIYEITPDRKISNNYVSGSLGTGWALDYNSSVPDKSYFEVDNLLVRDTIRTHIFQKDVIKATNGQLYVSDSGVIAKTYDGTEPYVVHLDVDKSATFSVNDEIVVKDVNLGSGTVTATTRFKIDSIGTVANGMQPYTVSVIEGTLWNLQTGMTAVRISGGAVLIDAVTANSPFIDVLYEKTTKARLGNLNGISGCSGYGLWSDNVYLTGAITATSGTIGGWSIDSTAGIYSGTGDSRVQMKTGVGFWAGDEDYNLADFYVSNSGLLRANNAQISGTINATNGNFQGVISTSALTTSLENTGTFPISGSSPQTWGDIMNQIDSAGFPPNKRIPVISATGDYSGVVFVSCNISSGGHGIIYFDDAIASNLFARYAFDAYDKSGSFTLQTPDMVNVTEIQPAFGINCTKFLHGFYTENQIFDALSQYIVLGASRLATGEFYTSNGRFTVSRVNRTDNTKLTFYGMDDTCRPATCVITDGSIGSYYLSIAI